MYKIVTTDWMFEDPNAEIEYEIIDDIKCMKVPRIIEGETGYPHPLFDGCEDDYIYIMPYNNDMKGLV